jgi:hypothetical protein
MEKKFFTAAIACVLLWFVGQGVFAIETCEKYGTVSVSGGSYIVQNNCWGSDARQCISVADTNNPAFTITASAHSQGNVASYPSVFKGCHWDMCTSGWTSTKVSSLSKATYSWSVSTAGVTGVYDVAAEAWFSPSLDCSEGYNGGVEMMIWMDAKGGIVPAGSKTGTYGPYEVWKGSMSDGVNTWTYICYYRIAQTSVTVDLMGFIADSIQRGYMSSSLYLHDIEAGFELMSGGAGLKLNSFSATVTGGGSGPQPVPTPDLDPLPSSGDPCPSVSSTTQTLPYTFDGSGIYCWTFSSTPEYINSNNMEVLAVNGVDFTGKYVMASELPAKIDGKYYVYYKGNWDWSHFNAAGAIASEPTPGVNETPAPTATPSETNPPTAVPSATPVATPVAQGNVGDVNNDGSITIVDALLVAQYYVGMTPSVFFVDRADANCDGNEDIIDALLIAQYYVGLISSLGC